MPSSRSTIDNRDVYYRLGKSAGYRARSAYKLLHLDEEFDLFTGVETAVDLCAAPGSWSQVLTQRLERDASIVALDLQPMAPLPNVQILQADITRVSTVPLVLDALGARKADLVVCDGAPDVTGVHDLDAYLHSQLILAAFTLSLLLLAPHGTLIFKIFLSHLDPKAAILQSQLEVFFPSITQYPLHRPVAGSSTSTGLHPDGGVFIRKPRSSRAGSAEAFIVCRNFDPSRLPFPPDFSTSTLAKMSTQADDTLTLSSLSRLVPDYRTSAEWDAIEAWVGAGSLGSEMPASHVELTENDGGDEDERNELNVYDLPSLPSSNLNGVPYEGQFQAEGSRPRLSDPGRLDVFSRQSNATRRAAAMAAGSHQLSTGSKPPSSPTSPNIFPLDRHLEADPTPLPSPNLGATPDPFPPSSRAGTVSPTPSTSSKNDLFFSANGDDMPIPPKPLPSPTSARAFSPQYPAALVRTSVSLRDPRTHRKAASTDLRSVASLRSLVPTPTRSFSQPYDRDLLADTTAVPDKRPGAATDAKIHRERRELPKTIIDKRLQEGSILDDTKENRWRLMDRLGEGAFSSVWSARRFDDAQDATTVYAIKVTSKSACKADSRTRVAFEREVTVLQCIVHPNIVSFIASFSSDDFHCMVLEKLSGVELFDVVNDSTQWQVLRTPSPGDQAGEKISRRIFGELIKAVTWLHEVNIIHRDIKLENILLVSNPFKNRSISLADDLPSPLIKLTDFGLSRFIDPQRPLLNTRCGSESFAAPEIIMGLPYDGRDTDSWACGVVLYALVTGNLPFDAPNDPLLDERLDRKSRMLRIAKASYSWPPDDGTPDVRSLVGRLLVRDPQKRARVGSIWDEPWMNGPGAVSRLDESGSRESGPQGSRRVLDGYLVDGSTVSGGIADLDI